MNYIKHINKILNERKEAWLTNFPDIVGYETYLFNDGRNGMLVLSWQRKGKPEVLIVTTQFDGDDFQEEWLEEKQILFLNQTLTISLKNKKGKSK
jgi:hypothetical protein